MDGEAVKKSRLHLYKEADRAKLKSLGSKVTAPPHRSTEPAGAGPIKRFASRARSPRISMVLRNPDLARAPSTLKHFAVDVNRGIHGSGRV
jgi:hypothetical protein